MKVFEEWWKTQQEWAEWDCGSHKHCAGFAWIAALEWVRDELCPGNGMAGIRESVEQELGEE